MLKSQARMTVSSNSAPESTSLQSSVQSHPSHDFESPSSRPPSGMASIHSQGSSSPSIASDTSRNIPLSASNAFRPIESST